MSAVAVDASAQDALEPCPAAPRCICSPAMSARHRVVPLVCTGSREEAHAALLAALESMPRMRVLEVGAHRIRAVQRSRLWRFADDVELFLPARERLAHVPSASRVGCYDSGAKGARGTEPGAPQRAPGEVAGNAPRGDAAGLVRASPGRCR